MFHQKEEITKLIEQNKRLCEHIAKLNFSTSQSSTGATKTEVLQHNDQQKSKESETSKKITPAGALYKLQKKKIGDPEQEIQATEQNVIVEEQQQRIKELGEEISKMKVTQERLLQSRKEDQEKLQKLLQDRTGMIDHAKRQSTSIMDLKKDRDSLEVCHLLHTILFAQYCIYLWFLK